MGLASQSLHLIVRPLGVQASRMIRKSSSVNSSLTQALAEVSRDLCCTDACLSLVFLGTDLSNEQLQAELVNSFGDAPVIVCTTAGEISPGGFQLGSVCGVSFPKSLFSSSICEIEKVDEFSDETMHKLRSSLQASEAQRLKLGATAKSIALLFIDGMSRQEEYVASYLSLLLKGIPLVGGSAGDNMTFQRARIFCDGKVRQSSAVVAFLTTKVPFRIFKTQHFSKGEQPLVVTSANAETRRIYEINGEMAATAYAKAIGVKRGELKSEVFSANPLVINIGGELYVRSIKEINDDDSFTLFCSIEEGLVLTIANKHSLVDETEKVFGALESELGTLELSLFFECIHRRIEIESFSEAAKAKYFDFYKRVNALGFYTYGEQYCGLHINQTLTGVAFGSTSFGLGGDHRA